MSIQLLENLATECQFAEDYLYIDVGIDELALKLREDYEIHLSRWANIFNKKFLTLRSRSHQIRISAQVFKNLGKFHMTSSNTPTNLLWMANTSFSPTIVRLGLDLADNPRRGSIVRLSDERQILMASDCDVLVAGYDLQTATSWSRTQYFLPEDLEDFRRLSRQQDTFEKTWRAIDPESPERGADGWTYTTRVTLIDGQDGNFYHLSENIGYNYTEPVPN